MRELQRLGWGDYTGRLYGAARAMLAGLSASHQFNTLTASGRVTVVQLARMAGVTPRHATSVVQLLEDDGLIEWDAGGLDEQGGPIVSFLKINKRALVELLATARAARDEQDRQLRAAFRLRALKIRSFAALAGARRQRRKIERLRRSLGTEMSSALPLQGVGERGVGVSDRWVPETCPHDSAVGKCPSCRRQTSGAGSAGAQTTGGGTAWRSS